MNGNLIQHFSLAEVGKWDNVWLLRDLCQPGLAWPLFNNTRLKNTKTEWESVRGFTYEHIIYTHWLPKVSQHTLI